MEKKKMNGWVIGAIVLAVAVVGFAIWWNSPKQKEKRKIEADKKKALDEAAKKAAPAKLANAPLPGSKMLVAQA